MSNIRHWQITEHLDEYGDEDETHDVHIQFTEPIEQASNIEENDEYRGTLTFEEKKQGFITYNQAYARAKVIQKRYPKRILCGSIALMLYNIIPKRSVHDIDFVKYEKNVIPNEFISLKCSNPFEHDLFLSADVKEGKRIGELLCQDVNQIISWKLKFGRKRDYEDLDNYIKNQYFSEEEFLVGIGESNG